MSFLLAAFLALAGSAHAGGESTTLPFQSFNDPFAVQALQQVLDDKLSLRGGFADASLTVSSLTVYVLAVYSQGNDIKLSTAASASVGSPGSIWVRGTDGSVWFGKEPVSYNAFGAIYPQWTYGHTVRDPVQAMICRTGQFCGYSLWSTTGTLKWLLAMGTQGSMLDNDSDFKIFDQNLSDAVVRIGDGTGNVGIGTTATPRTRLDVVGNAQFSGNVGIGTTQGAPDLTVYSSSRNTVSLISQAGTYLLEEYTNSSKHYGQFQKSGTGTYWITEHDPTAGTNKIALGGSTFLSDDTQVVVNGQMTLTNTLGNSGGSTIRGTGSDVGFLFNAYGSGALTQRDTSKGYAKLLLHYPSSGTNDYAALTFEPSTKGGTTSSNLFVISHQRNVGIGAGLSPSHKLHVVGGALVTSSMTAESFCIAGNCLSDLSVIATADEGELFYADGSGNFATKNTLYFNPNTDSLAVGHNDPFYTLHVNGPSYVSGQAIVGGTLTAQGNAFSVGGSTFVVASGDVGIGDSTPDYRLDVSSHINTDTALCIAGDCKSSWLLAGTNLFVRLTGDAMTGPLQTTSMTVTGNGFSVGASTLVVTQGQLGIGTTPNTALHVLVSRGATSAKFTDDNNSVLTIAHPSATNATIDVATPGSVLNFAIQGTTEATITGTGVGIGTTAPGYPLHVVGGSYVTGQETVGGSVTVQGSAFSVGASTLAVASGFVGVGTASPASVFNIQTDGLTQSFTYAAYGASNVPGHPRFIGRVSSGTASSPAVIGAGWNAFSLTGQAYDGAAFRPLGNFQVQSDSAPTSGAVYGLLILAVSTGGTSSQEALRVNSFMNVGIGATSFGTNASKVLALGSGTPPSSSPADMVQLYSTDTASTAELHVRDEAGNITVLSPHRFKMFLPDESDPAPPWSYYSRNDYIGKEVNVDMVKLARLVEQLTGEQIVYVQDIPNAEVRDWAADEESKRLKREQEIAAWEASEEKTGERPKPYVKKAAPAWLAPRLKRK